VDHTVVDPQEIAIFGVEVQMSTTDPLNKMFAYSPLCALVQWRNGHADEYTIQEIVDNRGPVGEQLPSSVEPTAIDRSSCVHRYYCGRQDN